MAKGGSKVGEGEKIKGEEWGKETDASNDILSTRPLMDEPDIRADASFKEIQKVAAHMQEEYGDEYGIANWELGKFRKSSNAMAACGGNTIIINDKYMNPDIINAAMARCAASGFHPSIGNKSAMEAVIAHEFGHSLVEKVGRIMGSGDDFKTAHKILDEAIDSTKFRRTREMAKSISGYAKVSPSEAVAEACSDVYCNGKNAKPASIAIMNVVNNYLKKQK